MIIINSDSAGTYSGIPINKLILVIEFIIITTLLSAAEQLLQRSENQHTAAE
jgi:hypothetical protein